MRGPEPGWPGGQIPQPRRCRDKGRRPAWREDTFVTGIFSTVGPGCLPGARARLWPPASLTALPPSPEPGPVAAPSCASQARPTETLTASKRSSWCLDLFLLEKLLENTDSTQGCNAGCGLCADWNSSSVAMGESLSVRPCLHLRNVHNLRGLW